MADDVVGTGFQCGFHQGFFVDAGRKQQIALVHKLKGHAAVGAQIAAVFVESMAHISYGAGFVVGEAIHHQRGAADAVAFVAQFDVFHAFQVAAAFVDGALDVVFGHIGIKGFVHGQAQARIGGRVAAAHFGGHGDFFNQAGKNFTALGVLTPFAVLDIGPFAVTCHNNPLIK